VRGHPAVNLAVHPGATFALFGVLRRSLALAAGTGGRAVAPWDEEIWLAGAAALL